MKRLEGISIKLSFFPKKKPIVKFDFCIAKSPVFTHINASMQGITTIRAFGVEHLLSKEFDVHQDTHSSAYFTFMGCTRTFAFWIDSLSAIYIVIVTYSLVLFFDGKSIILLCSSLIVNNKSVFRILRW